MLSNNAGEKSGNKGNKGAIRSPNGFANRARQMPENVPTVYDAKDGRCYSVIRFRHPKKANRQARCIARKTNKREKKASQCCVATRVTETPQRGLLKDHSNNRMSRQETIDGAAIKWR
jgi:hypothetical protein